MERPPPLEPLPYHREILDYLRQREPELWNWFVSNRVLQQHADAVRLSLLKTTYRIDRETQPRLYEIGHEAAARLGLDGPITFYQAQSSEGLNASLALLPEESHVILHGPIAEVLVEGELSALIGHELSHRLLWTCDEGRYLVADQILAAMTNDATADEAQCESARLFRLYTEVFCDRGSLAACGDDLGLTVSALVKAATGLREISAESYLKQADEIFSRSESAAATQGTTHPEHFIRARSLRLWKEQGAGAEEEIRRMIEGPASLAGLDLLGQTRITKLTRRFIDALLAATWMQTDVVIGHARLFFEDYQPPDGPMPAASLAGDIESMAETLKDYFCYVLLDFATTDRDLDEAPLAAAFLLADEVGLAERFEPLVRKELQMRKKQLEKLRSDAEQIVARAAQATQVH